MPRANRYFLPGYVWHITHRCHKREFLLKFPRDRKRWRHWLFEAKNRYGLCVLNYAVTSNHVHLLVYDNGKEEIPPSMQLVSGRTAQEYNRRKKRKGAFWEDRYHATAIATGAHLAQCLVYIDLNMVRAGVVKHPEDWVDGGYAEMLRARQRYKIMDQDCLMRLLDINTLEELLCVRQNWIDEALANESSVTQDKDLRWSDSLAIGGYDFVNGVKAALGLIRQGRQIRQDELGYILKEADGEYKKAQFSP